MNISLMEPILWVTSSTCLDWESETPMMNARCGQAQTSRRQQGAKPKHSPKDTSSNVSGNILLATLLISHGTTASEDQGEGDEGHDGRNMPRSRNMPGI